MKKFLLFASSLLVFTQVANSQPFKHMSLGLELATTGTGIQVAVPIIKNHLVVAAGYNFGNADATAYIDDFDVDQVSDVFNKYIDDANAYLSDIPGESRRLTRMPGTADLDLDGKIKLGAVKAIVEYYPAKKSSFHINAGFYAGSKGVLNANAAIPDYWNAYNTNVNTAKAVEADYSDYITSIGEIPELRATVNGRTFGIKDDGKVNLGLEAATVRPYFGLGFGRSIPKKHFGFQFDLGAIYFGKLNIVSTNETGGTSEIIIDDDDITEALDVFGKICFYPQMSFRLIYRIF